MKNDEIRPPTGITLRRRVRSLTFGVAGAAVLATGGVTATMAYAQIASHSAGGASTAVEGAGGPTGSSAATASAGSAGSTGAGVLAAPIQPPTGGYSTGHVGSGGS